MCTVVRSPARPDDLARGIDAIPQTVASAEIVHRAVPQESMIFAVPSPGPPGDLAGVINSESGTGATTEISQADHARIGRRYQDGSVSVAPVDNAGVSGNLAETIDACATRSTG